MSLASRIAGLKTDDLINIGAIALAIVGIICIAQQDTATSKKDGTRIFGGICLGLVSVVLAYRIYQR